MTPKKGVYFCVACYHPLHAFQYGVSSETGKPMYKICPEKTEITEVSGRTLYDYIEIPCGKCIGCRLEYSRQWANRCMLEMQYHEKSCFVTLTYDDEHLIPAGSASTGEVDGYTLCKRDVQLWMKRLRKKLGDVKIRYFGCGEYGDHTYRPHYHFILFGYYPSDSVFYKRSSAGFNYYTSEFLSSTWSDASGNPLGYVVVANATWETCAYTARYIVKKLKGDEAKNYNELGLLPPFVVMSRKPGIGYQYFQDHPDLFDKSYIYLAGDKDSLKFRPPKYFRQFLSEEDQEQLRLKMVESGDSDREFKSLQTDSVYYDMLEIEEMNKEESIKSLKRIDC